MEMKQHPNSIFYEFNGLRYKIIINFGYDYYVNLSFSYLALLLSSIVFCVAILLQMKILVGSFPSWLIKDL